MTPEATDPGSTQRGLMMRSARWTSMTARQTALLTKKNVRRQRRRIVKKLTKAYIGRVNEFQGRIADVRRTVDVAKKRAENGRRWNERVTTRRAGLLECLAKVGPQEMHATVDAFDAEVAALTEDLLVATNQRVEGAKAGRASGNYTAALGFSAESARGRPRQERSIAGTDR